tara:strand:- start:365 stop:1225 length:861 start_codon:yes stop_codon:yes gene_type:complete
MTLNRKKFIFVLGTSQDGGYPHLGCKEKCCSKAWEKQTLIRYPSSIAYVDTELKKYWLFDISPKIKEQMYLLRGFDCELAGIFLTHAHFGHYVGLLELGLEVLNSNRIPVFAMSRMFDFINNNNPFTLLIENKNIVLRKIENNMTINIDNLNITALEVPHRNELSETVCYKINTKYKSVVYMPDIDTFNSFESDIISIVKNNDVVFLDGTFYSRDEIKNRDVSEIPHPEIVNTMSLLSHLNNKHRKKIYFIHLNHTNPIIDQTSEEHLNVLNSGFQIAEEKQIINM